MIEHITSLLSRLGVEDLNVERSQRLSAAETGLPEESPVIIRGVFEKHPLSVWIYDDEIAVEWMDAYQVLDIDDLSELESILERRFNS